MDVEFGKIFGMRRIGRDDGSLGVGSEGSGLDGTTRFSSAMSSSCCAYGGRFSEQKCASSKTV